MAASSAMFWRRQARRTARRHNLGGVLGAFLPICLGLSAVFACALLIARENGGAGVRLWGVYGLGLLTAVAVALWRTRKGFFTVNDALVRLEWHLGLHNRLSAAAAGVGEFPAAQPAPDGYVFQWRKIAPPLGCAVVLVGVGAFIPVSKHAAAYVPTVTPVAWTQTAGWIDALKKTGTLQEPALEDLRERLEQLRKQPAEDWFSQSSLEAGDSLHEQTAQSMQALQHDLRSAANSLEAMQHFTDGTSAREIREAHENLANALNGLKLGNLPLNRELLDGLKQADLSDLKNLSAKQLEELKRCLKAGDKVCQACLHPGEMEGKRGGAVVVVDKSIPGGKGGGTSSAPLDLNARPSDLDTSRTAAMSNPNLDHAAPGDLLGVGKGEHSVDPAKYAGPASGGTVAANGEGGEAVWHNDLTPKEREVLKNFFK